MRPFIVIRPYEDTDAILRKDLIRKYVMSFAFDAFISCIFREIFIQLIVFVAAIMFIFFGLPLFMCIVSIPLVIVFIYLSVYGTFLTKALELSSDPITTCWVAEAHEPYTVSLSMDKKFTKYDIVHESRLQSNDPQLNRMKRTLIGTISIDEHRHLPGAAWLNHCAIDTDFNFDTIAEPLIIRTLKHAADVHMDSAEMTTTECQMQLRELLMKIGFEMKQIYHRRILGSANTRIMKSQMGIDLKNWTISKNK